MLLLVHLHQDSPVSILRSLGLPAQVLDLDIQAASCTYYLTSPSCSTRDTHTQTKKAQLLMKAVQSPAGRRWMSDVFHLSGISGLSFDSPFLSPLMGSSKGLSNMKRQLCRKSVLHMNYGALCPFVQLSSGFCSVTFCCALSDTLAHYSSDRFIQRTILVVLHVSLSLVVSSPANSVDMFQQHPSVSIEDF